MIRAEGPRAVWAVLLLFAFLSTAYNVTVPVFEAADEHTHYFVAQHIARSGRLPVQSLDAGERGPWEQEGSQPPLYYGAVAPLIRLTGAELEPDDLWFNHQNTMGRPALLGNENRFVHPPTAEGWPWHGYALAAHLARAVSTLMAAAAVVCVWLIAQRVFVGRSWLAVAAAALVAFNPQFLHLSATVTNDNAMNLLASSALVLLLRVADGRDDRRTVVALALVVGLAPLAKLTGLALLGFAVLFLCWLAWRRRARDVLLRVVTPIIVASTVLSGWWYVRNLALYDSVTGLNFMLSESMRRSFHLEPWLRGLPGELYGLWLSTWGIFGWFTIMMPTWFYRLANLAGVTALVGVAIAVCRRAGWVSWRRIAWLVIWAALVFASLLRWMMIAKGGHGRLLFPGIAALAVVLVLGWRTVVPVRISDRTFALGVAAVTVFLAVFALLA